MLIRHLNLLDQHPSILIVNHIMIIHVYGKTYAFQLQKYVNNGITKIGVVFNLDEHDEPVLIGLLYLLI